MEMLRRASSDQPQNLEPHESPISCPHQLNWGHGICDAGRMTCCCSGGLQLAREEGSWLAGTFLSSSVKPGEM